MSIQVYEGLKPLYGELQQSLVSSSQSSQGSAHLLKERVNALSAYMQKNKDSLSRDLFNNEKHVKIYEEITHDVGLLSENIKKRVIEDIQRIFYKSNLLKLEAIAKNQDALLSRLNQNPIMRLTKEDLTSSPSKVLDGFDWLKEYLRPPQQFRSDFDKTLSKMVVSALNLEGKKPGELGALFKSRQIDARALSHFVNAKEVALCDLGLSVEELSDLAPFLHYVDCQDIEFKDNDEVQKFIGKCSGAYHLLINSDKIKELKGLPASLESLKCTCCFSLTELSLSNLQALREIECEHCISLKAMSLSNCLALEELNCTGCVSLTELPLSHLLALKKLNCTGCISLIELSLSNLQALREIECEHCTSLKAIFLLNLLALEALNCDYCTSLKVISLLNLQALKLIYCSGCTSLTSLNFSNLHALEILYCTNCTSLTSLNFSDLVALTSLLLNGCTSLKELFLLNLLALNALDCSGCTSLTELTLLNPLALVTLILAGCSVLQNMRAQNLPSCTYLDHSDCPRLRQLPQLPYGCNVISHNSIGFTSFEVDPEHLKTQPFKVLCDLGKHLLKDKRMPNIVYLNSAGRDFGGLRRQLVTTLLKNLFKKDSPLESTKKSQENLLALPLLSDLTDPTKVEAYRTLGALIALASFGSLPLGRCLRDNFYYALLSLTDEEIKSIDLNKPLDETLKKKIYQIVYTLSEDDKVTPEELDEWPFMLPIAIVAKEFKDIVGEISIKRLRELGVQKFIDKVAGEEVTWEAFAKKAVYKGDPSDIEMTQNYFEKFFIEYEKAPDTLTDMIELFTSSRALGEEKIKIDIQKEKSKERLFEISTCFQQVSLPMYENYDKFKEKLFKTIELALGLFDKA